MARFDAVGLFWEDHAPVKPPKKVKPKSIPPEPIWLLPDYLPGLSEARAMRLDLLSDEGLTSAWLTRERFVFDIESYPNWWFIAFKSLVSGKVFFFELIGEDQCLTTEECRKLTWVMTNLTTVGFNSRGYDEPISAIAAAGGTCRDMFNATDLIIKGVPTMVPVTKKGVTTMVEKMVGVKPHAVLKRFKVQKLKTDSIDLIELVKLRPSLKICAGRCHAKRMQDLPFVPGTMLSEPQIVISRWYCVNDLDNTALLYFNVLPQIELREKISARYKIDVRSRSDAQIAEDLLSVQIKKRTGQNFLSKTTIKPGTCYKFEVPKFIKFESALMNHVLQQVRESDFIVAPSGKVFMPKQLKDMKIEINTSIYQMGIGGLHSTEKKRATIADENYFVKDRDVTSYYPWIIINSGLKPANLGQNFSIEYRLVVEERVRAKAMGDTQTADTYKIVANGSFGKFGSKWSILYAPQLLIQTTLTGQLSILMLIERLEIAGFMVVSANTDGIVTKGLRTREAEFEAIIKQWEVETGFNTEETEYKATYSRDINNYVAIYDKPQKGKHYKGKGIFGEVPLDKNPVTRICYLSAVDHIINGTDYRKAIRECRDIKLFTSMQKVNGGGYKNGVYLGKAIRWYYGLDEEGNPLTGPIINAKNGNTVARSEGAKPCMELPSEFPTDINFAWYEQETEKILKQIGYNTKVMLDKEEDEDEEEEDEEFDPDEVQLEN